MGQYYKKRKIGTCESMYYMRLTEARELAEKGAADDDGIKFSTYLTDGITRFRFPFPDEDSKELDGTLYMVEYDKGFNIPVGDVEVNHDHITVGSEHEDKSHYMNIMLPCPHSKEFKELGIMTSNDGAGEQYLTVRYQGMRYLGETHTGTPVEKTIFACARCGQEQYFTDDDIAAIKSRAMEYFEGYNMEGKNPQYDGDQAKYNYAKLIIQRIK